MRHIFLTTDGSKIREVYGGEELSRRMQSLGIDVNNSFIEKDLGKQDFSSVEYIFSTWSMPKLTEDKVKHYFPALKAIFYAAGTVKYFAKPFINCGVDVFSADYANAVAVSDFVSAEIMLATKGYYQAQYMYKHRRFTEARQCAMSHTGNYGAVVGIIGAGKIGRLVIQNLKHHDLMVLACDPMLTEENADSLGCEKVGMNQIFRESDIVSNHLPDIDSTAEVLNYDLFKQMKDYATFINTGRGRQVNEQDLIRVLKENKTISAVLDVMSREPMLSFSSFYTMDNIFITPHIAGSTNQEQRRMGSYMLDAYVDFVNGRISPYLVPAEKIDLMT